jgi:glycosyltransferase involved in cell wall biosynthesis
VPLGVDLNKYSTFKKKEDGIFRILFVGTVNPEKGIPILIQAILELKLTKIELILNGPIPYYFREDYEALISKCQKSEIIVKLEPGDPTSNYQKSSIFVLHRTMNRLGWLFLKRWHQDYL